MSYPTVVSAERNHERRKLLVETSESSSGWLYSPTSRYRNSLVPSRGTTHVGEKVDWNLIGRVVNLSNSTGARRRECVEVSPSNLQDEIRVRRYFRRGGLKLFLFSGAGGVRRLQSCFSSAFFARRIRPVFRRQKICQLIADSSAVSVAKTLEDKVHRSDQATRCAIAMSPYPNPP